MQSLPEDQQAALAILSYAVSETNALAKLYICQSHEMTGIEAIDLASTIQRFVVLRSWSARLFEIEQFLTLGGKKKKTDDSALMSLASAAIQDFESIRTHQGYAIARDLRNEATSHYSFDAAKKNLSHVSNNSNCTMYLHELNGNSFFPLGEEVMFQGRLNRKGSNLASREERAQLLKYWYDWNLLANKWLADAHVNFIKTLVIERFEGKGARKKTYWVPKEFVGTKEDRMTPVFLEKSD